MNLTKELRKAPLPVGFYNICGEQGAGKTSLAVALLRADYKRWRNYRYNLACEVAEKYYEVNGVRLDIDHCLYFSSTEIILNSKRGIKTHEIDLDRLGLPNPEYEVQYLPRGSVIFIMEADILAYCHNWQQLSDYLRNLIKYVRHFHLTVIFDMQIGGALAKALRELVMGIYYVFISGVKRFLLFWKRQVWQFLYVYNQRLQVVKEFSQYGIDIEKKIKVPITEWGKFRVWGNVFDCYNSYSALPYFLDGIDKVGYVYREHHDGDLSIAGIKAYCEAHPLEQNNKSSVEEQIILLMSKLTKKQRLNLLKKLLSE